MTYGDLEEHVWKKLGPRKLIAGRRAVTDLTRLTVEQWQGEMLVHCGDSSREMEVVTANITANVKRMYHACSGYSDQEFGFLWTIILSSIVSAIVQVIIKWWFSSARNRVLIAGWQKEFTK